MEPARVVFLIPSDLLSSRVFPTASLQWTELQKPEIAFLSWGPIHPFWKNPQLALTTLTSLWQPGDSFSSGKLTLWPCDLTDFLGLWSPCSAPANSTEKPSPLTWFAWQSLQAQSGLSAVALSPVAQGHSTVLSSPEVTCEQRRMESHLSCIQIQENSIFVKSSTVTKYVYPVIILMSSCHIWTG